jgi:hypothetical protein
VVVLVAEELLFMAVMVFLVVVDKVLAVMGEVVWLVVAVDTAHQEVMAVTQSV